MSDQPVHRPPVRVGAELPHDIYVLLRACAAKERRPAKAVIVDAVQIYLSRHGHPASRETQVAEEAPMP